MTPHPTPLAPEDVLAVVSALLPFTTPLSIGAVLSALAAAGYAIYRPETHKAVDAKEWQALKDESERAVKGYEALSGIIASVRKMTGATYNPETHAVLPRVVTEGMVRDFYGAPPHEGPSDNDVSVVQNVLDTFIAAVEGPKP
jgi:ATP-dependent Zn protease